MVRVEPEGEVSRSCALPSNRRAHLIETLEPRIALSFTVMNTADSGTGSLRQAILDANASPGADTIDFAASFTSSQHTIIVAGPPPQISGILTINGPGASLLTVTRNGVGVGGSLHAFDSFATSLTLTGMTVTGGNVSGGSGGGLSISGISPNVLLDGMVFTANHANGNGGAISLTNNSTLIVRNSVISNNTATALGGGIFFFDGGSLVVDNCTISGNTATGTSGHDATGGGIYFNGTTTANPPAGFTPSTVLIRNSTFNNNTATHAGGAIAIDTFSGTLLVQNCTIASNTAGTSGGGISQNDGPGAITLQDSTISGNGASGTTALLGGGGIGRVSTDPGSINLSNSIVSGNTNTGGSAPDMRASAFTTTNVHFSAIGSASGFTLSGTSGNNLAFGANLLLGALANNGGTTQTMLPAATSPLVNAGSNALVPADMFTDQRGSGFVRVGAPRVDIGAVERNDTPSPIILEASYQYLATTEEILLRFNQLAAGYFHIQLQNLATSTTIPHNDTFHSATPNYLSLSFADGPSVPDGNYRLTVVEQPDFTFDFFVLAGDANRDRHVDVTDLGILATNWQGTGRNFSQADFNYDGKVDVSDLGTLATNWQKSLPAPAAASATADDSLRLRRSKVGPPIASQVLV